MMSLQKAAAAASLRCRLNNGGGVVRFLHLRNGNVIPGLQPLPRQVMSAGDADVVSGGHHWHGKNEGGGGGAYYNDRTMLTMSRCSIHTYANTGGWRREKDEQEKQKQQRQRFMMMAKSEFHSTSSNDKSAVALMLGFGALAAVSYAGAQGIKAYNEFKASLPVEEPVTEEEAEKEEPKQQQARAKTTQQQKGSENKRENIFKEWFGVSVGAKYYEGGFEDKMTKSEAALILGVRESSPTQRIKEAHKRLVVLNHPDTGGSTYMAGKINEAKELLLKGRMDK